MALQQLEKEPTEERTFKSALTHYHQQTRKTKPAILTYCINTGNSKEKFSIIKEFVAPADTTSSITLSQNLCNNLGDSFCNKITAMYGNFNPQLDHFNLTASLPIVIFPG